MSGCEETGRTIAEAVEKAVAKLGIKPGNAKIEVIEEPAHGLLGIIGSRNAVVQVSPLREPAEYIKFFLATMLEHMRIEGNVTVDEDDDKIEAEIYGRDVGALIGRRGKTLGELQYLTNVAMKRQFGGQKKIVVIDVENYRARREKTLIQLARSVARRVGADGYEQALEPMNPQERRIIHLALQDYPGVYTCSDGEEPYRKVVISPK